MSVRVRGDYCVLVAVARAHDLRAFELARLVVAARHAALVPALRPEVNREQVRGRAGAWMVGDLDHPSDGYAEPLEIVRERHAGLLITPNRREGAVTAAQRSRPRSR